MEKIAKKLFCCLNSKKSKNIDYFLITANFLCLIFYITFFYTISWSFINILNQVLLYLNFVFLACNPALTWYIDVMSEKPISQTQASSP